MVKSEIIDMTKNEEISFPRLMKSQNVIVLFNAEQEGFVVHTITSSGQGIGYRSYTWSMSSFSVFTGRIELISE